MLQSCLAAAIHSTLLSRINVDNEDSDGDPLTRRCAPPSPPRGRGLYILLDTLLSLVLSPSPPLGGAGGEGGESTSSLSNTAWDRTRENVPGGTKSPEGFLLSHGQLV
jgi:hypothetical protein